MPRRKPYLERFKERMNDVPIDGSMYDPGSSSARPTSDPEDSSSGPHSHRPASAAETSLDRDIGTSRREGTEDDSDEPTTTHLDKGKQRDYGDSERQEQEQEQEQLDEIDEVSSPFRSGIHYRS